MSIKTEHTDGLAEMELDAGAYFTWRNQSYPCVQGPASRDSSFDSQTGGVRRSDSTSIVVRNSVLTVGVPSVRDIILLKGIKYRGSEVRSAPHGSFVSIDLVDPNE